MTSSCRSIGTTTYDLRPKAATQSGGVSEASLASSTITGRRVSIARALVGTSRSGRLVTLRNWSHMAGIFRPSANCDMGGTTRPPSQRSIEQRSTSHTLRPEDRLAALDDPADPTLARRQRVVQLGGQGGIAVRQRAPQPARGLVQAPHADVGRVEELGDGAGEVGEHLVGIERRGDEPVDLLQRAQPLRIPRGLLVQARVLEGGGGVGGEALE